MSEIFGYFEAPHQTKPAFDPGRSAPCPVCLKTLGEGPVTTISLFLPGDNRSFFFRAHKPCWSNASAEEQAQIEGSLIDARATRLECSA